MAKAINHPIKKYIPLQNITPEAFNSTDKTNFNVHLSHTEKKTKYPDSVSEALEWIR